MALKEYDFEKEPTVSIVKKILIDSIKMKATDIHFDPQQSELLIKFRINGTLVEYTTAPENYKVNILTRIKILSGMNITEALLPQVGSISFDYDGITTNMRVSSLPVSNGEKIVVHMSNYAQNLKSISRIGIYPDDVEKIKKLLKEPQGIILITGTTASGKTTTMYSLLKELNSKSVNIISIEDPIKMKIDGINQVQISPEKGLTYKSVLRNVLLQDPNVICINELVDDETTRSAIRASVTGRLVISTMYTKNAYTTIDTLLNMDVENYLLGSNLLGIISQRLVKKLCPNCREKKLATTYEKTIIKHITGQDVKELYINKGCTECQSGYTEQLPVLEVIPITDELRNAISNNKDRKLIQKMIYKNNTSIIEDAFAKVINGETTFNEAIRIMDIKIDFTEEDDEIKEFILGNIKPAEDTNDIEKDFDVEEKEETTKEEVATEKEITKEVSQEKEEEKDYLKFVNIKESIKSLEEKTLEKIEDNEDDEDDEDDEESKEESEVEKTYNTNISKPKIVKITNDDEEEQEEKNQSEEETKETKTEEVQTEEKEKTPEENKSKNNLDDFNLLDDEDEDDFDYDSYISIV